MFNNDEESKIRAWAEKKIAKRNDLQQLVVILGAVSLFFWGIWAVTMFGEFPWPLVPMMAFAIALGINWFEYHNEFGGGYMRKQDEIEQEIARERERLNRLRDAGYSPDDEYDDYYTTKRKNDE